jgi:putative ABC transport system permease protein
MSFLLLALRNSTGNAFRSWVVVSCAALMAGFSIGATIIIGGAEKSLNLALDRLGADIIVVPAGTEHLMENAYLMGIPALAWMPEEFLDSISNVPGVEIVSPQFYLSTLRGAVCCSVPEMFLIAYDPETDFTLTPWLEENIVGELGLGEAVGGSFVYVPVDPGYILVYGYHIHLKGKFSQTGTGLDQSMFFTFDTAREISRLSPFQAEAKMEIPENSISAAMVKTSRGIDPAQVATQIQQVLPEVTPVESSNLFKEQRMEILAMLQSVTVLLGVAWLLSVALIGLLFSMAVNERKQEIGVLRAIGSTRQNVLNSLLAEGMILAFIGGILGTTLSIFSIYLFRNLLIQLMGFPFLIPSPLTLALISIAALAITMMSVALGVLFPAIRISTMDPAVAMRK